MGVNKICHMSASCEVSKFRDGFCTAPGGEMDSFPFTYCSTSISGAFSYLYACSFAQPTLSSNLWVLRCKWITIAVKSSIEDEVEKRKVNKFVAKGGECQFGPNKTPCSQYSCRSVITCSRQACLEFTRDNWILLWLLMCVHNSQFPISQHSKNLTTANQKPNRRSKCDLNASTTSTVSGFAEQYFVSYTVFDSFASIVLYHTIKRKDWACAYMAMRRGCHAILSHSTMSSRLVHWLKTLLQLMVYPCQEVASHRESFNPSHWYHQAVCVRQELRHIHL